MGVPIGRAGFGPQTSGGVVNPHVAAVRELADSMTLVGGQRTGTSASARRYLCPPAEVDFEKAPIVAAAAHIGGPAVCVCTDVGEESAGLVPIRFWTTGAGTPIRRRPGGR